jgi:PDZ domain-containing protein
MSGREQLIPRDIVYPPDKSKDEINQANTQEFKRSESNAESAALGYLKYAPAVTVATVDKKGAAAGKLQEGDAIDAVDGVKVTSKDQFQAVMAKTKPDQEVTLGFRRKNAPPGVTTIKLRSSPDEGRRAGWPSPRPPRGFLGIAVVEDPWAPFTIDFNLANIGGPSAGLVFSLAVIDKLTTGNLTGSKFVAGTGTIDGDGKVGKIGGITHKIAAAREDGATVFLVPADNCVEATSAHEDGIDLVKVENLEGAVKALKALSAGGEAPRC